MKIRTDFVTNSSSSSFISYTIRIAPFAEVVANNPDIIKLFSAENAETVIGSDELGKIGFRNGGYCVKAEEDGNNLKLSFDNDGGWTDPSLPQLLAMSTMTDYDNFADKNGGTELYDVKEYEDLNRWDMIHGEIKRNPVPYNNYVFKQKYTNGDIDIVRMMNELYMNTDFFDKILVDEEYSHGGGEACVDPEFCNFHCSGERTVKSDGKIEEYDAHPYFGGFSYMGSDEAFIQYDNGKVSFYDRNSDFGDCIWSDSEIQYAIDKISDMNVTTGGLRIIATVSCAEVTKISLPATCYRIDGSAFEECSSLKKLYIHRCNVSLGDDFVGSDVHLYAPAGGSVEKYAEKHGNPFTAIGSDDEDTNIDHEYYRYNKISPPTTGGTETFMERYEIELPEESFFNNSSLYGVNYIYYYEEVDAPESELDSGFYTSFLINQQTFDLSDEDDDMTLHERVEDLLDTLSIKPSDIIFLEESENRVIYLASSNLTSQDLSMQFLSVNITKTLYINAVLGGVLEKVGDKHYSLMFVCNNNSMDEGLKKENAIAYKLYEILQTLRVDNKPVQLQKLTLTDDYELLPGEGVADPKPKAKSKSKAKSAKKPASGESILARMNKLSKIYDKDEYDESSVKTEYDKLIKSDEWVKEQIEITDTIDSLSDLSGEVVYSMGAGYDIMRKIIEEAGGTYRRHFTKDVTCFIIQCHDSIIHRMLAKKNVPLIEYLKNSGVQPKVITTHDFYDIIKEEDRDQYTIDVLMNIFYIDPDLSFEDECYLYNYTTYIMMKCRESVGLDPHSAEHDQEKKMNYVPPCSEGLNWVISGDIFENNIDVVLEELEKDPSLAEKYEKSFREAPLSQRIATVEKQLSYYFMLCDEKCHPEKFKDFLFEHSKPFFTEDEYPELKKQIDISEEELLASCERSLLSMDSSDMLFWETAKDRLCMRVDERELVKDYAIEFEQLTKASVELGGYLKCYAYPTSLKKNLDIDSWILYYWGVTEKDVAEAAMKNPAVWGKIAVEDEELDDIEPVPAELDYKIKCALCENFGFPKPAAPENMQKIPQDWTEQEIRAMVYAYLLFDCYADTKQSEDDFWDCYIDTMEILLEQDIRKFYKELAEKVYSGERDSELEELFRSQPYNIRRDHVIFCSLPAEYGKSINKELALKVGEIWIKPEEKEDFLNEVNKYVKEEKPAEPAPQPVREAPAKPADDKPAPPVNDEPAADTQTSPAESEAAPKKKEGCYIATAVYGSYDAPEVMVLRRFRDEVLKQSLPGRAFIMVYYTLSPPAAKWLKNTKHLNASVRSILDKWVEKLKK